MSAKIFGVPTAPSPTGRALQAMEILWARPTTTAAELGERLGVSERAARRYVEILREAGLAVESVRGPYGGYRLGTSAQPYPVLFTEAEALRLVMAVLEGRPAAAGDVEDPVGQALAKVIRVLPDAVGRQAAALRAHASAAPDRHAARPDPALTSAIVAAVASRQRVLVGYRSEAGNEWETEVDPWAVVVRHGRWYLLCHSHRAGAVRTYRLDRIISFRQSGHCFTPPEGLDPVATLEASLGTGWEYPTRVVFEAPVGDVASWIRPTMGQLVTAGDGCILTGSTSNPVMYAQEWLAAVPFAFRVEAGPELRAAVAALAARCAAAVEDKATARRGWLTTPRTPPDNR